MVLGYRQPRAGPPPRSLGLIFMARSSGWNEVGYSQGRDARTLVLILMSVSWGWNGAGLAAASAAAADRSGTAAANLGLDLHVSLLGFENGAGSPAAAAA